MILRWCQIPNTVNTAKKTVLVMTVVHLNIVLPVIVIVLALVAKMMSRKSKSQKSMSQKVQKMMIPGIDGVTGPLNNNSTSQFVEEEVSRLYISIRFRWTCDWRYFPWSCHSKVFRFNQQGFWQTWNSLQWYWKKFYQEIFYLEGIGWSYGSYKYARSLVSERPSKCVLRSPVINALQAL